MTTTATTTSEGDTQPKATSRWPRYFTTYITSFTAFTTRATFGSEASR
ncbi:MAG: hypothetical protein IPI55_00010 [Flavobacteriales bacterium]|nr:hypothetical protein [Flavobacteriales bacterium]